jgi:hypothetical protein
MPELTETELRNDPLAGELRAYFQTTTATPSPLSAAAPQRPAAPAPWHRRPLRAGLAAGLALVVAAAIAVPVVINRMSIAAGDSGALLVFTNATVQGSCRFVLETEPLGGGPLRSIGTVSECGAFGQPVIVGDHAVSPATRAPDTPGAGLDLIDLRTGTERTIPLEGVDGSPFPSPDGTDLAVPVATGADQLPALDVFDAATGALLRQLEPEVRGSVVRLGVASGSTWLSDGIHTEVQCVGDAAASCDYLIDPVTGAVRTLAEWTISIQEYGSPDVYGSPDGTEEAHVLQQPAADGPGGTSTVSAGPMGGTLSTVYTATAAMIGGVGVADDGTLMFQANALQSSTTYVASQGRVQPVAPPPGWTFFTLDVPGGWALPGGGFAIEATRQSGGQRAQEEVLQVSDSGSTTVIQGPLPAATSYLVLIGVAG